MRINGYDKNHAFIRDDFGGHKISMDAALSGVDFLIKTFDFYRNCLTF